LTERSFSLQGDFLDRLRKDKVPTTIFLTNGIKLQGVVTCADDATVLLRRDGHVQLIYKHAISTVMPSVPLSDFEGGCA